MRAGEQATMERPVTVARPLPRITGDAGYAVPARLSTPPTLAPYHGETYYGLPPLKPSPFGWKVALYIWLAGMGGAAQIIATLGDLLAEPRPAALVRRGRYLALVAATAGPVLLVIDLHTPQRFFNMLRIFRKTSGMSIGTYVLMSFSTSSILTAFGQFLADRRGGAPSRLARAAQLPAAVAGAGMTTYTAALLSGTSTPLWAAAPCLLAMRFASSAVATGAAALSLGESRDGEAPVARSLDMLALAAAGTELAASLAADLRYRETGVAGALHHSRWGAVHAVGVQALGLAVPIALLLASRRKTASRLPLLAAAGILAGGFLMRSAVLHAGNESTKRPRDYFRMAQPGAIPENRGAARLAAGAR